VDVRLFALKVVTAQSVTALGVTQSAAVPHKTRQVTYMSSRHTHEILLGNPLEKLPRFIEHANLAHISIR
jgi:hypothetical protein